MKGRALVPEALLASAEGTEVFGSLGNDIIKQVEADAAILLCIPLCQSRERKVKRESIAERRGGM